MTLVSVGFIVVQITYDNNPYKIACIKGRINLEIFVFFQHGLFHATENNVRIASMSDMRSVDIENQKSTCTI